MDADKFRDRAAVWRQRAAERHYARAKAADLQLAEEYERLAATLSASAAPIMADDLPAPVPDDAVTAP